MLRRTKCASRPKGVFEMVNVLCCSGYDPTGGAGIQADIEAVAAQGAHALPLITALTVQDTNNVSRVQAVDAALLAEQLHVLLADCRIAAIKIGLLGGAEQLPVLAALLKRSPVPVVLDPILRAGGGAELTAQAFAARVQAELFPLCTLLTPNAAEARRWSGETDLDAAAKALLSTGARHVLITGGDEPGPTAAIHWYSAGQAVRVFEQPRLPGSFHGAGCTLAASIAARLGVGESMEGALQGAQQYVHQTLLHARAVGQGRLVPRRILEARAQ